MAEGVVETVLSEPNRRGCTSCTSHSSRDTLHVCRYVKCTCTLHVCGARVTYGLNSFQAEAVFLVSDLDDNDE